MNIEPTAVQALYGTPHTTDSSVSCDDCTTDLEAGNAITVQTSPQEEWTPIAAFCPACTPDATDDRPVTVEGRLTITIDPRTGMRMLTFVAGDHDLENLSLETRSMEPPATTNDPDSTEDEGEEETEDDDPTEDPIPDPDHVLIPFRSNRADRVFHFDDGEGTPCCEFTGEYEPVAAFLIFSLSTL